MSSQKRSLIALKCASCSFRFRVEARFAGRKVSCPNEECGVQFTIPTAEAIQAKRARRESKQSSNTATQYDYDLDARDGAAESRSNRKTTRAHSAKAESKTVSASSRKLPKKSALIGVAAVIVLLIGAVVVTNNPDAETQALANSESNEQTGAEKSVEPKKPTVDVFREHVAPFMKKYCYDCHSGDEAEAGLQLEMYTNEESILAERKRWEKLFAMVEIEAMPPSDMEEQPTESERKIVVGWLEDKLFNIDCTINRDPGRVTIRRLNRAEYNNTIRDLVGVDFKPAEDFPSDDVGYGFDNIGDVLTVSPLLLEKYLAAAEQITEKAIVANVAENAPQQYFAGKRLKPSGGKFPLGGDGYWVFASTGYIETRAKFPKTGDYIFQVVAKADQAGNEPARLELKANGRVLKSFDVLGDRTPNTLEVKVRIDAGDKQIVGLFPNDFYDPKNRNPKRRDRNLLIKSIKIVGPIGADSYPESHRRIMTSFPDKDRPVREAATAVLRPFARRAFRRPVMDAELEKYVSLVQLAIESGDPYEVGIQLAIQGLLVSPEFLFRVENSPAPDDPNQKLNVGDFELASRLSYFLWSSMPDDELLKLAEQGQLANDDTLSRQVRRMLTDPRSKALAQNFGKQWLNLGSLDELVPDNTLFPEFSDELRHDMVQETLMFFGEILHRDRSLMSFLDGKFTFVNERLAKHYGIPNVRGNEFRRVDLKNLPRAGVLTHASILTLTSNPTRTSPVKRGKWIMENILGSAPPPPPPDVPELEVTAKASPSASLREQLEVHRQDPGCASCHRQMDELGFGFENFNAIGIWRNKEGEQSVDASGTLPGNLKFNGPLELIEILKERDEEFARALSEKLLTYALGRGLEYYDKCAVDQIVDTLKENDYRISTMIQEIVRSEPFRMRRGDGGSQ